MSGDATKPVDENQQTLDDLKNKNAQLEKELAALKDAANAQSPEQAKAQLEKDIATLQNEAAKLKKDAAVARKEAFKAMLPESKAMALDGTATVDDKVQIEAQTLVYRSMAESAHCLAKSLTTDVKCLIIHNVDDVAGMQAYSTLLAQLGLLEQEYKATLLSADLEKPGAESVQAALLAPAVIGSVLGSIADIAALFRSNVEVTGVALSPEHGVLVSQLAFSLASLKLPIKVIYPAAYLPIQAQAFKDSSLLKAFNELISLRAKADNSIDELEAETAEQQDGKSDVDIKAEADKVSRLRALNALYDKVASNFLNIEEQTGPDGLIRLLRAEFLTKQLAEPGTFLLLLSIVAAGGSNRTTRGLWRSAKVEHSGGSVINYQLFDTDGTLKLANALPNATGYVRYPIRKACA